MKLQPPGAGLPTLELWLVKIRFGLKRWSFDREKLTQWFEQERAKILELVENCPAEQASQPVLIDRIRGMEDSSRFWSVYMTVDHLCIVNKSIAAIIDLLAKEQVPQKAVRTADVKPRSDVGATVVKAFDDGCEEYRAIVEAQATLKTKEKFPHPWIGQMNALDWHALAAKHMSIHRTQIESIRKIQRAAVAKD